MAGANPFGDDLDYMHARHGNPLVGRFLSVDRVGGTSKKPQSWNRYAYARGNPLLYVDPNGMYVVVATKDRSTVSYAYANSASFRKQFDLANQNQNIIVRLESVSSKDGRLLGRRGNSAWSSRPTMDGSTRTFKGVIASFARKANQNIVASAFGHELVHANELARYGDLRKAGARQSADGVGNYETDPALATEREIGKELQSNPRDTMTREEMEEVFGPSAEWDRLTDEQRQECLSNVACLTLYGSAPNPK
jgi:RHS repeat-associated protein